MKEKLEVLALATETIFHDGKILLDTVSEVLEKGGIPVIPWGFGKWWGRRGEILTGFLNINSNQKFYLGDNGGRPAFYKIPFHFELGYKKNVKILNGSDPLPLPSQFKRVGNFGFVIKGVIDPKFPARSIKELLFNSAATIQNYGALENPIRFVKNQVLLKF